MKKKSLKPEELLELALDEAVLPLFDLGPVCEGCGCSEFDACPGGCGWSERYLEQGRFVCTKCEAIAIAVELNLLTLYLWRWRLVNPQTAPLPRRIQEAHAVPAH